MSLPLKRRVFIGSSTEGARKAEYIGQLLANDQTEVTMWTKEFAPGYVPFGALGKVLETCDAAVFIATPDDPTKIREKEVRTPRANVMLEFGLFAGRLGVYNIAICLYPNTELPSDLKGMTVIEMEPAYSSASNAEGEGKTASESAEDRIKRWRDGLLPTVDEIPRTSNAHGYSGAWDIETIGFRQWRGVVLSGESWVQGSGTAVLYIDETGKTGHGLLKGKLGFKICSSQEPKAKPFSGELSFCHEVADIDCDLTGGVRLVTRVFCLQKHVSGHPPSELFALEEPREPWPFSWTLAPSDTSRCLHGTLEAENPGATKGEIRLRKYR